MTSRAKNIWLVDVHSIGIINPVKFYLVHVTYKNDLTLTYCCSVNISSESTLCNCELVEVSEGLMSCRWPERVLPGSPELACSKWQNCVSSSARCTRSSFNNNDRWIITVLGMILLLCNLSRYWYKCKVVLGSIWTVMLRSSLSIKFTQGPN